jgi:pyrroloquinoline-quinone synthase
LKQSSPTRKGDQAVRKIPTLKGNVEMTREGFWNALKELLEKQNLLTHPFYQAWSNGELSQEDICEYAIEYYQQVASFPVYLREFASRLPDSQLKHKVLQTLWEEIGMKGGDDRAHNLLWLDFAVAAGALPSDVFNHEPIPSIKALTAIFHRLAKFGDAAQALVAFYVYESQVPAIAQEKAHWLQNIYGFQSSACEYFTLHATADIAHSQIWRDQLNQILEQEPIVADHILAAAELVAAGLWKVLDGVNAGRVSRLRRRLD